MATEPGKGFDAIHLLFFIGLCQNATRLTPFSHPTRTRPSVDCRYCYHPTGKTLRPDSGKTPFRTPQNHSPNRGKNYSNSTLPKDKKRGGDLNLPPPQ